MNLNNLYSITQRYMNEGLAPAVLHDMYNNYINLNTSYIKKAILQV